MMMMRVSLQFFFFCCSSLLLLLLHSSSAFTVLPSRPVVSWQRLSLRHATPDTKATAEVPIIINGQNIALTPALVEYVNKRIGTTLSKLATAVKECDVVLSVHKNPKVKNGHRVEVVTNVKGTTILCHDASPDMYASIDACAAALQRKLRQYKERRTEGWHGGNKGNEEFTALLEEMEAAFEVEDDEAVKTTNGAATVNGSVKEEEETVDFTDPEQPHIMKVNSFQLDKPISVEEAVFALDYVDHDFYVFRNEATNEINVVYKRHTGGVGLVAP